MAELFLGKVLAKNNKDRGELDTEWELSQRLENRVVLLYFGAARCSRCQEFAPMLKDFFVRLTDEFYVTRASQLALVYVPGSGNEEEEDEFLDEMPRKWLSLPFKDRGFKQELESRFGVEKLPAVVVLKPCGKVISWNAVEEIRRLGLPCFKSWQEVGNLIDRNFLPAEFFDNVPGRSITDPIRRLKYKPENEEEARQRDGGEGLF
ncbi:nucleoredoxin-like protein 1 [Microcaecilia unicolor]|uniref:Nucleoredoxin-like protein 1 n=1 Tax=Microcaecilia unicolor TaxID=1415580 RepID=A0A6P7X4M7_9AMPH|nr:nucleoredoxin-like protein 1 [Microcaecilia unicolor]